MLVMTESRTQNLEMIQKHNYEVILGSRKVINLNWNSQAITQFTISFNKMRPDNL